MGADIKQLRTRIKSVDSTLHLTKAMGLVASSKIRKATESMNKGKAYADALGEMIVRLANSEDCRKTPYMAKREGDRTCLVVVAGDRGLAGGYNANIFRLLRQYPDAEIIPIGKRACDRFGGRLHHAEHYNHADAMALAQTLCQRFCAEDFDRLGVVCTRYHSMMSQEAYVNWLLPLVPEERGRADDAIFEPDAPTVLNAVIPEYIAGMILSCVKESFASEVAARRVAMDSAGKNAQEMIDRLGLEYNRARQSAITQEITEIVAGSGV
ncbi:MAG: ATP synthase F1 subunit gamma [Oscillospiraceae bacterium]|nr:ATP synthase F1 subunit gamma [Oscillospiraceae bacterium]